ncbi:MAG TPA: LysM peptidoglycan-binding domain-containing protein [Desulfobacteria bacterium]|nr:LysM peptidoglycan-binding domain-containing protein [Desulfobacteria bacterium]
MPKTKSNALLQLYIDVAAMEVLLFQDDQLVRRYPVLSFTDCLPFGKCIIADKNDVPAPGQNGAKWLALDKEPLKIFSSSYGDQGSQCHGIQIGDEHVQELLALVPLGTQVEITNTSAGPQSIALPNQFGRFPATPSAFPVVSGPRSYIVRRGDTIWKLSRRFNIPMERILSENLLPDPNRLEPGQIINLPLAWP